MGAHAHYNPDTSIESIVLSMVPVGADRVDQSSTFALYGAISNQVISCGILNHA